MCALGSVSVCFAFGVGKGAKGADKGGCVHSVCPGATLLRVWGSAPRGRVRCIEGD